MNRIRLYSLLFLAAIAVLSCDASALEVRRPVVNVNTATEAEFTLLPGVGPVLASRLNDLCEANDHRDGATFRTPDDLLRVKGIGPKLLERIRPYVVLKGKTTATVKIRVPR